MLSLLPRYVLPRMYPVPVHTYSVPKIRKSSLEVSQGTDPYDLNCLATELAYQASFSLNASLRDTNVPRGIAGLSASTLYEQAYSHFSSC